MDVPKIQPRTKAWITKKPSQPAISHIRLVSSALSTVPDTRMMPTISQPPQVGICSVKWYGGAMLAHGNTSRMIVIPKLDGFM
jgi:hypothetical protein